MIWDALFGTVEGWIAIGVTLLSVALAIGFRLFIRKQINKELAAHKQATQKSLD